MILRSLRLIIFSIILVFLSIFCSFGQVTAIKAGYLFDTNSGEFISNQLILIENGKVSKIEKLNGDVVADEIIDLTNAYVLPGLIDLHVHLEMEFSPSVYIKRFTLNKADLAYDAAVYARRTLLAGFTSVRDLGGSGVNTSLAKAIAMNKVDGPRIFSAGKAIGTTGGHADPTNGFQSDIVGDPGPKEGVINGREDARKAVRQRYKNGAQVIKITATGGVLSLAKNGIAPQFTMDELAGIVEAANDLGMVTAAHAHGTEGMKRAVEAGINSIEHGSIMSEEVMDLMIEKGTYYVPTLSAGIETVKNANIDGYYPEIVVPKAKYVGAQMVGTFKKAYEKGVKIAFGTDSGVTPHGDNAKEFQYMVEAGMSTRDAILSATVEASKLLQVENEIGSLKHGASADIIAVKINPLEDIKSLQNISFVMKTGVVYKQ